MTSREAEPETSTADTTADLETLSARLDSLLVTYLSLLDKYTTLRAQLSQDFSSGFFALAQANRNANSTLGVGRRYGEEGFDERMKAGRVLSYQAREKRNTRRNTQPSSEETGHRKEATGSTEPEPQLSVDEKQYQPPDSESGASTTNSKEEQDQESDGIHDHDTDANGFSQALHEQPLGTLNHSFHITTSPTSTKDPLKWYGIFVPPPLRYCQSHFTHAVISSIDGILNTASAMREVEEEIWNVRRDLGILGEYKDEADVPGVVDQAAGTQEDVGKRRSTESGSEAGLSAANLLISLPPPKKSSNIISTVPSTGLPHEPRSRVLKMG